MKRIRIIPAAIILLFCTAFTTPFPESSSGLRTGDKAPLSTTEMKGTDGQMYSLEKLNGKKGLIVIFSCNTCPFVVGNETFAGWEIQYNDLYRKAQESGIGMVLVNSNEAKRDGDDSPEAMLSRATTKQYAMPYLVDAQSALANAFGAKTTPHVYFFNEKLELIYQGAIDNTVDGKRKETVPYLLNAMQNHIQGKAITETSTPPRGCSIKRVS